jgi:6-pyruvoyltetrahydropterin/6-carboxytetrahydropterin synthase
MYLVRKRGAFCAAHRLHSSALSEEENRKTYGKCNSATYHGHTYALAVIVGAEEMDPQTDMVVNFYDLEALINSEIIDKVDHKNLNLDVDFLQGVNPTAENLARVFFGVLEPKIPRGKLLAVSVSESEDNEATYCRDGAAARMVF